LLVVSLHCSIREDVGTMRVPACEVVQKRYLGLTKAVFHVILYSS